MEALVQNEEISVVQSETTDALEAAKELILLSKTLNKPIIESWDYINFPNLNKVGELVAFANASYMQENISLFCVDNNSGNILPLIDDFLMIPQSPMKN